MDGYCAFCQKYGKLTGEHRWSNWLNSLYGERQKYTIQRHHPTRGTIQYKTIGINDKSPSVCAKCNSTWMSNIEDEVKPLLGPLVQYGPKMSFLPSGIALLATFVFLKAVISDHRDGNRKTFFSIRERVDFMRRLQIPSGIQMWIASSGVEWFEGIFQSYVFGINDKRLSLKDARFFCFTWGAGRIGLQLLAVRWKPGRGKGKSLPVMVPDPHWDAVSMRFWPNNARPITWNPASDLSAESFKTFRDRLRNNVWFPASK